MKPNYIVKHFLGTALFFAIIFLSAGRIDYWQGWIYAGIGLAMAVLNYTVFSISRELLNERSQPGKDTKRWDKAILRLTFLATIAMYAVAGLDSGRYHWSPDFHWICYGAGILLTAAGQLLFLVAQKQNKFFSSTIRIQTERGHTVCDTGLYKVVRHPAYLGMIVQSIGFPLLFGSLWSIIPVGFLIVLVTTRTCLEDRTLRAELQGFREYAEKTLYRIIPGIW